MLADICRQYETAATNPVFECRCLDVTPSSALKRDRDPGWLQVNISITDPSVTPTLQAVTILSHLISNLRQQLSGPFCQLGSNTTQLTV